MATKITVQDYIEEKRVHSMGKIYVFRTNVNAETKVFVKVWKTCAKHGEKHLPLAMCSGCEADDLIVKMCIAQTGMKPAEYQARHGIAWNE